MSTEQIILFSDESAFEFFELLKELRPHLTFPLFLEIKNEASSYNLIGLKSGNQLVALMGYRIISDFVHGRHLYIDDLVTSQEFRSKGYGEKLLNRAEFLAKENMCSNLRLCTGIDNKNAMRFYEKNSWNLKAVVYKKKL
jgi:ribosomal protein S18 acetylase RimI-like enzyme